MAFAQIPHLSKPDEVFSLTTTGPTYGAPAPAGALRFYNHPTYGMQVYRLVLNETGSTLAAGTVAAIVAPTATGPLFSVRLAAETDTEPGKLAGVVVTALADGKWGWILAEGIGLVLSSAAYDVNDQLDTDASGKVDDDGTGACVGTALAAATGADELKSAFIKLL
jgi:hypothetical protein